MKETDSCIGEYKGERAPWEEDACLQSGDEEDFDDDFEEDLPVATCIFCTEEGDVQYMEKHLVESHNFDLFDELKLRCPLKKVDAVYARLILINYLRSRPIADRQKDLSDINPSSPIWQMEDFLCKQSFSYDALAMELEEDKILKLEGDTEVSYEVLFGAVTAEPKMESTFEQGHFSELLAKSGLEDDSAATKDKSLDGGVGRKDDEGYFETYGDMTIHRVMIRDAPRTDAYKNFILQNKDFFAGKVVLDIGCGSGILSMFASQAGAKKVVGLDAAVNMSKTANHIIRVNGFKESEIQLCLGKVEEHSLWMRELDSSLDIVQTALDAEAPTGYKPFKCDAIISEWMGYGLLYESMLLTVLNARDRYLSTDGILVPSKVEMKAALLDRNKDISTKVGNVRYWDEPVYGLNMSLLKPSLQELFRTAEVVELKNEDVVSSEVIVWTADLVKCTVDEVKSASSDSLTLETHEGREGNAIGLWFDCIFETGKSTGHNVRLSTSPFTPLTHWGQVQLVLYNSLNHEILKVKRLEDFRFSMAPHISNHRLASIALQFKHEREEINCLYDLM